MYFASHLANTVSYETVKLYLVAVQDLHRELSFPLMLNDMHRLREVLTGITADKGTSESQKRQGGIVCESKPGKPSDLSNQNKEE